MWIWFLAPMSKQVEIVAAIFESLSKRQINLPFFLSDWYWKNWELKHLSNHNVKGTSNMNLILSSYRRSYIKGQIEIIDMNHYEIIGCYWVGTSHNEYESVSWISMKQMFMYLFCLRDFFNSFHCRKQKFIKEVVCENKVLLSGLLSLLI